MLLKNFELIKKIKLTHDVFELTFSCDNILKPLLWQFITFLLPNNIWARPYSILECKKDILKFIIKRVENWKWASKFICDSNIWDIIKWVWPTWKFVLQENKKNKLFFWTWTGIVPLYNQVLNWIKKDNTKFKIIFWVKTQKDLFYINELEKIKKEKDNFKYQIFLSQEESTDYTFWRIKDFINYSSIDDFWEFYICWNPFMVDDVEKKLLGLWVGEKSILKEKY